MTLTVELYRLHFIYLMSYQKKAWLALAGLGKPSFGLTTKILRPVLAWHSSNELWIIHSSPKNWKLNFPLIFVKIPVLRKKSNTSNSWVSKPWVKSAYFSYTKRSTLSFYALPQKWDSYMQNPSETPNYWTVNFQMKSFKLIII